VSLFEVFDAGKRAIDEIATALDAALA